MMPNEITEEYVKSMVRLYSTKEYNEFSEEELAKLERLMIEGIEDKND